MQQEQQQRSSTNSVEIPSPASLPSCCAVRGEQPRPLGLDDQAISPHDLPFWSKSPMQSPRRVGGHAREKPLVFFSSSLAKHSSNHHAASEGNRGWRRDQAQRVAEVDRYHRRRLTATNRAPRFPESAEEMSTTAAVAAEATPAFENNPDGEPPAAAAGAPTTEEQPAPAESGGGGAGGGGEDFAWETSKENVMPLKRGRKVDAIHNAYESGLGGGGGGGLGCSSSVRVLAGLKRCDARRQCLLRMSFHVCAGRHLNNAPCEQQLL